MSSPTLVMQVCPPPRGPRRDPRMVWFLAGSLAVHLGAWAVLEATPPEDPSFDAEQGWDGYPESFVDYRESFVDYRESFVDYIPREFPESSLDLEHCDVRSDDWASCVLDAWGPDMPVDGTLARSDWAGYVLGASISPSDYLRGPAPCDLSSLYGLEDPCSGGFDREAPYSFPGARLDPKLGVEIRGPRYQFAHHERPTRSLSVSAPRAGIMISSPGYDRSIVRRYLRRHLGEIAACHEAPRLALHAGTGDVAVMFFISPTGAVQASSGDGFDSNVARCVANVIKTITFPRPADGGGVQVRAPFHFQAPRD